jgi:hypothetical protein
MRCVLEKIKNLKPSAFMRLIGKPTAFLRLIGVKRETFEAMLQALQDLVRNFDRLWLSQTCRCIGDSGSLGLNLWHSNSQVSHKNSKHHPLTPEQKSQNRRTSSERIVVEHASRRVKVLRILSERYCNRRKRFGL